jgi:O-antigen/teichoic acid export membrane protein
MSQHQPVADITLTEVASGRRRRELYVNTIATWGWAQGSLLASVVSLPLLTRFLPKAEFGLWAQMLSLGTLATIADFGLSTVFLRYLAKDDETSGSILPAATRFYCIAGGLVALVLAAICFVPGGVLAPFRGKTELPAIPCVAIIAAIVVNLALQPYAIKTLARGRMDLLSIFGAGPAIAGAFATVPAAYLLHSALGVGVAYGVVEIGFDVALITVVRVTPSLSFTRAAGTVPVPIVWKDMLTESWGILVINLAPQLTVLVDATVVGHVDGAVSVAVLAVALRVGDLIRRLFSPFSQSLFVSLCRARGRTREAVERHVDSLAWLTLAAGLAAACLAMTVGSHALTLVFGHGYDRAETAMVVLLLAATVRAMYLPAVQRLQADAALGSLPRWFLASLIVHIGLAIALTEAWSILGTAIAVLLAALVFEFWPVIRAERRTLGSDSPRHSQPDLLMSAGLTSFGVVLVLAWYRLGTGGWSAPIIGLLGVVLGALSVWLIVRYLRSSRSVIVDS